MSVVVEALLVAMSIQDHTWSAIWWFVKLPPSPASPPCDPARPRRGREAILAKVICFPHRHPLCPCHETRFGHSTPAPRHPL